MAELSVSKVAQEVQAAPKFAITSPSFTCSASKVMGVIAFAIVLFSIISYFTELSPAEVSYGGAGLSFVLMVLACVCQPKDIATQKMVAGTTQIQKFIPPKGMDLEYGIGPDHRNSIRERNLGLVCISKHGDDAPKVGHIYHFNHSSQLFNNDLFQFCRYLTQTYAGRYNLEVAFGIIDFDQWKNKTSHRLELVQNLPRDAGAQIPHFKVQGITGDSALFAVGFTQLDFALSDADASHTLFALCAQFLIEPDAGRIEEAVLFPKPSEKPKET